LTREELLRGIEVYAASARRTFEAGKNPLPSLSRVSRWSSDTRIWANTA